MWLRVWWSSQGGRHDTGRNHSRRHQSIDCIVRHWLYDELRSRHSDQDVNFEFDSIGFEIITKSVFAKIALDEENLSEASMLFEDVFNKVKESSISKDTKEVLLEQYYENLIRLSMELENFNMGDNLIKDNKLDTVRYHDVAGDFYKHFQENEIAIYHYDQAMLFDIDDSQKNLIKLKKPIN